ncbi:MAG: outer membrane lipoprotein carrier protein LolA [Castellaniella sp.]
MPARIFRRCFFGLLLAASFAVPLSASAAPAADPLAGFVAQVQSAQGHFEQMRELEGAPVADSRQSGQFAFERPGKFRWAVELPFEQLIVSDGRQLYQYDPDLAQVIERDADTALGASPAAILFGTGELGEAFELSARPDAEGLRWVRVTPRTPDAGFVHADLGFQDNIPRRLRLLDAFGQTSRIDFSQTELNPALPPALFDFQAPEGADIVHM